MSLECLDTRPECHIFWAFSHLKHLKPSGNNHRRRQIRKHHHSGHPTSIHRAITLRCQIHTLKHGFRRSFHPSIVGACKVWSMMQGSGFLELGDGACNRAGSCYCFCYFLWSFGTVNQAAEVLLDPTAREEVVGS